jgi:hypothetical protein
MIISDPRVLVADRNGKNSKYRLVASGPISAMSAGTWKDSALTRPKAISVICRSGDAANVNAEAPIGFVPARSTPTPPVPGPTAEPVAYRFPSAPQPTPDDRLATLKEALSFMHRPNALGVRFSFIDQSLAGSRGHARPEAGDRVR